MAVVNKVQTLDGRWYPSTVGCCSRPRWPPRRHTTPPWNTTCATGLGCGSLTDPIPIRASGRWEIVGVDRALNERWSTRRVLIKDRQGELASRFQRDHGRPPTPVEALHLAQQATLETREAKHEPRTLAEQRAAWHAQAAETLGGPQAVQAMITEALHPTSAPSPHVDPEWVAATAEKVLAAVEARRSTWQSWHVRAEAQRYVQAATFPTDKVDQLVELLVTEVLQTRSVALTRPEDGISLSLSGVLQFRSDRCERVQGCRIRAGHLDPNPSGGAATRRGRGPTEDALWTPPP